VAEFAFLGPIDGWNGFVAYVGRALYADIDHSATASWQDHFRYAGFALAEAARQYPWPATALAGAGFVLQWWRWPRPLCLALTLGFAGSTLLLAAVLGFDWDLLHRNTFSVYPVPAWAVSAVWLGLGVAALLGWLARGPGARIAAPVLHVGLGALLVGMTWLAHAPASYRAGDRWAGDFAEAMLDALPPGAALFVFGDYAAGPVAYARHVLGRRPDVTLYSPVAQVFRNRLFDAADAGTPRAAAAVEAFIASTDAPVYYNLVLPHRYGVVRHGLFFEVARGLPAGAGGVRLSPEVDRFFTRMFARGVPRDTSQLIHYRQLEALYCDALAALAGHGHGASPAMRAHLAAYCSGFFGLLAQAQARLGAGDAAAARRLLARARARSDEAVTVENLARLEELAARARRGATAR
jgi:hypothetical protein